MSDLVDDWTVDDTETAGEILTLLGIGCDASKEPGADWRRDKIAKLIRARISQQDAELERYRVAFSAIIERSHNDPLGTSKVVDMRRIAEQAIGEKP